MINEQKNHTDMNYHRLEEKWDPIGFNTQKNEKIGSFDLSVLRLCLKVWIDGQNEKAACKVSEKGQNQHIWIAKCMICV